MSLETIQAPTGFRFKQVDEHTVQLEPEPAKVVEIGDRMWSQENVLPKKCTYAEAEAACKALRLGGFDDWRLPTLKEVIGDLVDYSRHEPAIDTDLFPTCKPDWYWTSTIYAPSPAFAWIVYFDFGYADYYLRGYDGAFVRAVRSVAPGQ